MFIFVRAFVLLLSVLVFYFTPLPPAIVMEDDSVEAFAAPSTDVFGGHDRYATNAFEDAVVACPQCGSVNVIEIVYGYPTEETLIRAEEGEVRLGGCMVGYEDPDKYCINCDAEWLHRID